LEVDDIPNRTSARAKKNGLKTDEENPLWVDDIYESQKKYFKTRKGKRAVAKARKKYDQSDLERRRKQKREYMQRKRREDPKVWRV
jgi:hypothetical protein